MRHGIVMSLGGAVLQSACSHAVLFHALSLLTPFLLVFLLPSSLFATLSLSGTLPQVKMSLLSSGDVLQGYPTSEVLIFIH